MEPDLIDAYLRRLGVDAEPPSVDALFRIHRAQVECVPYETTWIALGEPWTIDSAAAMQRIATLGRGGYCFHLNGSLALVLEALGYEVTRHVGGVHRVDPNSENMTNHLVLTVGGLPTDENPGGDWYVDAGLGDALHEPLPLLAGTYQQGPMTFSLEKTPGGVGDWLFTHDPAGSFAGMSFRASSATLDEFADRHVHLSTSPDSGFVQNVIAQRRDSDGVTWIRSLTYGRRDRDGTVTRHVTNRDDWFAVLADEFQLGFAGVRDEARNRLWDRARTSHEAWLEQTRTS